MNKLLLGTSALVGVFALATSAYAADPAVNVGGFIDFQSGYADQETAFKTGASSRDLKFQNDTEIHVDVTGKADNGLAYGAAIELEADISTDADNEGVNADKTYIFLESEAGRVELGGNTGAQGTLKVDASSIARATGGIDGDWYDYINTSGMVGGANAFIIAPDLPAAHATGVREDASKITYYTPRFSGFQIGTSFTPDEGDGGSAAGFTGKNNGNQQNVWGVGANYKEQYNNVAVEASATSEFGDAEVTGINDTQAWALGLSLASQGFSVAGSWADWNDSGLATGTANDSQDLWTLGAAYETGPFGVSVTYLDSSRAGNDLTNLVVGTDYKLAPGLVPYVEVGFVDLNDKGTTVDNNGSVVLVGAELSF